MSQIKLQIVEVITETLNNVKESFPSIYSKEDVQLLLHRLSSKLQALNYETESKIGLDVDEIMECVRQFDFEDYFETDYSSAQFSMHRNCVELDEVESEFDNSRFERSFKEEIQSCIAIKNEQANELLETQS